MGSTNKYNWPAVFVAFCNNHTPEELAKAFDIPEHAVKFQIRREKWEALRRELPLLSPGITIDVDPALVPNNPFQRSELPAPNVPGGSVVVQQNPQAYLAPSIRASFETLSDNRKQNYAQADRLRQKINDLIDDVEKGKFKIKRGFHHKGVVVYAETDPTPSDLLNIATYIRTVHELTYRALGDTTGTGSPTETPSGGPQPAAPVITINLPAAIALPRERRALEARGAKVVEIAAEVEGSKPPTPTGG